MFVLQKDGDEEGLPFCRDGGSTAYMITFMMTWAPLAVRMVREWVGDVGWKSRWWVTLWVVVTVIMLPLVVILYLGK